MESKEEVVSDDGSYELVNSEDYASENMDDDVSTGTGLSDDSSYDLLCSDVSDTLVLTDDEEKSGDMEFKNETASDPTEGDSDRTDDEEGDMGFARESNSDLKVQPIPNRVNKGKKRDIMTMLGESTSFDLYEFPAQINLKNDIKEVAKHHITCYLPAKSLFKCRQVSKEWNKWLSGPFFAHMQSQYFRKTSGFFQNSRLTSIRFISLERSAYGVPYPPLGFIPATVSIKCSCNGLLLCQSYNFEDELFYICNPANKQWVKLPPSNSYHGVDPKMVLAFEPSSLNFEPVYQVVCLFYVPYPEAGSIVHFDIYDSRTKSWMVSDMICADLESDLKSEGLYVNGVVYWETTGGELLAFDLKNEIYSVQKLPFDGGALTNFRGELCYVRAVYDHSMKACALDVYGDGVMSLKNSLDVPIDDVEDGEFVDCTVLGNSCDDVVPLVVKASQGQERLYVYHVEDEKVQGLGFFDHSKRLFPYVNSLVSIDA